MLTEHECPWYVLDNSHKALLGACVIVFGISGVLLNSWMVTTFVQSHLLSLKSHLLVLNLCTACLGRSILGGFPFAGPSALAGRWLFGESCCQLFAFMHQLLGVFQMAALVSLCFERYLLVKRAKHGKELSIKFYAFCIGLCWIFSAAFSVPPLLKYGSFGCDLTGTVCTLDWRFSEKRLVAFNAPLALFAGFVPVIVIIVSLWKTVMLNRRLREAEREWEQWSLTKNTIAVASLMLMFWLPQGILSIWIATGNLGYSLESGRWSSRQYHPPPSLVLLAPLASEACTLVPLLCYLAGEPRIRTALLGRCKKDYGIIKRGRRASHFRVSENQ